MADEPTAPTEDPGQQEEEVPSVAVPTAEPTTEAEPSAGDEGQPEESGADNQVGAGEKDEEGEGVEAQKTEAAGEEQTEGRESPQGPPQTADVAETEIKADEEKTDEAAESQKETEEPEEKKDDGEKTETKADEEGKTEGKAEEGEKEEESKPDEAAQYVEGEEPVEEAQKADESESKPAEAEKPAESPRAKEPEQEAQGPADVAPGPAPTPVPQRESVGMETDATNEVHEVDPHGHSPRTTANLEATATVKFVLMPSGQVVTLACTLGQMLGELKEHFASDLKMSSNLILLMYDGKALDNNVKLADLGVGPNGTVQLEMQSADPVNTPIKTYRPRQEYHMPDVITVRVQDENGDYKDVVVEIERATRKQTFLGGYRHKKTGVEFYHAAAQTVQKQAPPSNVPKYCRDTQTVEQKHQVQQTTNDMSTQMTKIGVYVSNIPDKLLTPRRYTTADEHHDMLFSHIVIIQKYYRRWLAKRYVQKLKIDKKKRLEFEREEEIRKKKDKEERIKKEFERRMNPKNKEDFDLLYHALEKWRQEELERINSELTGAERKAALCMLLDQETQLISAIGRHKLEADTENGEKRIQGFLNKAASSKRWKGFDGKTTEMDTPYTIRAKELRDIYNSINMKYLTQDERLDVLLTLKHTVKEHDCKLTQEIIELIDREADLLMRGVKETNLDGLRKRISTLFLQYIKTPTFNPEAAKLLKVPQDPSTLRKNIYFCPSCNNYLPSTEFAMSSNSREVGKCRRCAKIDNDARTRQDFSIYRHMLKNLRRSEDSYGDDSRIAFLLQENDMRYLVEKIWNSQSILSAWEDLYDLVLIRWDRHMEWSPWNCILLNKEEAAAHEKLANIEEGYGQVFIHKVTQKHTLARNYFSRLPGMAEQVRARATQRESRSGPSVSGQAVPVQQRA